MIRLFMLAFAILTLVGCAYSDVEPAHKGRMFDAAGGLCPFGGEGLTGPVLNSGSYWTGICDSVRTVDCGITTDRETMTSLTKDGVQFSVDVYTRYSVNCTSDDSVQKLLDAVSPKGGGTDISGQQVFETFARPILGETIREAISPHVANDINSDREAILGDVQKIFMDRMAKQDPPFILVQEVNLSNMDFPDELDQANTERAQQAILRDKSVAERDRVEAETETAKAQEELSRQQGKVEAAKIDEIGAALERNPMYLQYMLQVQMPGIYDKAGSQGNMVIAGPNPTVMVSPRTPVLPSGGN